MISLLLRGYFSSMSYAQIKKEFCFRINCFYSSFFDEVTIDNLNDEDYFWVGYLGIYFFEDASEYYEWLCLVRPDEEGEEVRKILILLHRITHDLEIKEALGYENDLSNRLIENVLSITGKRSFFEALRIALTYEDKESDYMIAVAEAFYSIPLSFIRCVFGECDDDMVDLMKKYVELIDYYIDQKVERYID